MCSRSILSGISRFDGFSIVDDGWVSPPPSSDYIYNNPLYFLDALYKATTKDMHTYEEESTINLRFPEGYEHVEDIGSIHNIALRNILRITPIRLIRKCRSLVIPFILFMKDCPRLLCTMPWIFLNSNRHINKRWIV